MSNRENTPLISDEALEVQRAFMRSVKKANCRRETYYIVTLGCQMNMRDSETIAGMLEKMGYTRAVSREKADLILYNTCCVRENAENRALGNVIWLKELKKLKPRLMICVGGCMMQEAGMAEKLKAQYPFIDLIFGTHNLYKFPELLFRAITEKQPVVEVLASDGNIAEGLPVARVNPFMAYINIMYGCDNFCSYCIVPYVRGRERSRAPEDILDEAKKLLDDGVQEIMLLGQNVNSYGGGGAAFSELLGKLDRLNVPRIRFMTSHPKDLSDELIDCFASLKHLTGQLHLPVQSGSDRILSLMNRRYTREKYLSLTEKLRKARPDVGLTSDIIVGFPGETLAEFEETLSLAEKVRFDAAFTFIYSPRIGTKAALLEDNTPAEEKSARIQRLIEAQQRISAEVLSEQIGARQRVLVEAPSTRDEENICGKSDRGFMVNFPGNTDLIGKFVEVKITSAGRNTLRGERVPEQEER
ncbi:MAG: tRNA (N6-isopentenyl adenosine(37)-C2)-methylthiotransferase MiaB [Clostridia bacterium]